MDHSSPQFTARFSELVGLLVHRPRAVDQQKDALRAVIAESREGTRCIVLTELNHALVEAVRRVPPVPDLPWVTLLAARMAEHAVSALEFRERATPSDVLGIARALASPPVIGDEGAHFDALAVAVGATTVTARVGRAGFTRGPEGDVHQSPLRLPTPGQAMPGFGIAGDSFHATVRHPAELGSPTDLDGEARPTLDPARALLEASFTRGSGEMGLREMFERLRTASEPPAAGRAADDLVRTAEQRARDGLWLEVAEIFARLVEREAQVGDAELRRAILIHVRRLSTPVVVRGIARLLPRRREVRDVVHPILQWSGEVGADVLIELMTGADQAVDRRAYRAALVECPSAVVPLTQMLDDDRWFVVRNAVELLGEMHATGSDAKIVTTLKHVDARVRRSAATAIARLATSHSLPGLVTMLRDADAGVRLAVAHGIASLKSARATSVLLAALDREEDADVRSALYGALAAAPTDAGVACLVQAVQPGSLFNRRSAAARLPAIQALAEIGTPAALSALRGLTNDRNAEVRETVRRRLAAK